MTMDTPGTADITTGNTSGSTSGSTAGPRAPEAVGRGRHRRPRSRRPLLATAGLALAAGALSLVWLAAESGVGGMEVAEAAPGRGSVPITDRATRPGGGTPGVPSAGHRGDTGASPLPDGAHPAADAATVAGTDPTATVPTAPREPETITAPASSRSTGTSKPPRPAPTPPRATPAPPSEADRPGLCVPLIGVCVDLNPGNRP